MSKRIQKIQGYVRRELEVPVPDKVKKETVKPKIKRKTKKPSKK